MKKYFEYIFVVAASILVYVFISNLFSCGSQNKGKETVKVDGKKYVVVDKKVDTLYKDTIIYRFKRGKDILKDTTIYVPTIKYKDVDTAAILKEYFAKNVYKDTILINKLGYVYVLDTISENSIKSRMYKLNVSQQIVKEVFFLEKPKKNEVYVGGLVGTGSNFSTNFIGGSLYLKNKKDHLYGVSVGLTNNALPFGLFTVNYKIGKK